MSSFVVYLTGAETEADVTTANISNTLSGTTADSITDTWNNASSQSGTPDVTIEIDWSKHNFMDYMQLRWNPKDEEAIANADSLNGGEHKVEYIINKGYDTTNSNSRGFFDYGYSSNANVNPVTKSLNTLALDTSTLNNASLITALKNTHGVNDNGVTDAERSALLVYLTTLASEIFGNAGTLELISNEKTIADEVTDGGAEIATKLNNLINNQNQNPLSPNYIVGKLLTGIIGQHLGNGLYTRFQNHIEVYKMANGVFTKYDPKLGDGRYYDVISEYNGSADTNGNLVKADNLPHDLFNFGFRVGDTIRIRLNLVTDDNDNVVFTAVDSNGDDEDRVHASKLYEFKVNLIDDILELNSGSSDIAKTTNEDTATTGTIAVRYVRTPDLDLLGSGANENDSKLSSFSISSQPTNGTASINNQGVWTYVPNANYNSNDAATDTFTVLVKDKYGGQIASPLAGHTVSQVVTMTVTPVNDAPAGSVTLSGTEVVSNQLTASNNITDIDGPNPLTISYQWYRGSSAISGANSSTYDLVDLDAGNAISCKASYTDSDGTAETVTSAQSNIVAATISIVGTAEEDQTLSINLGDLQGANTYQWKRDGSSISGATSSTYTLLQDDVGKAISC
jgi:VCBS repeat-containing protein